MRRRSSGVDRAQRQDPVAVLDARAQRGALGAHRDLDRGRVGQPRDQARLQRARELGPQVRRQPHQLDRERRQQVRILASELARDLVHDVVDQLEEVDAVLRALNQLFDLAGRRGARGFAPAARPARGPRRPGWTPPRPSSGGPAVGGRRIRRPNGRRGARGRSEAERCGRRPIAALAARRRGVRRVGAAGRALPGRRRRCWRRAARRPSRARAPAGRRRPPTSNSRCDGARTQSPPGIGRRGGPAGGCLPDDPQILAGRAVACRSSSLPCRTRIRKGTRGSGARS